MNYAQMMSDFKYRSLATGLSISRLIYLQLRSRKPQMLVTNEVLKEMRRLRQLLGELNTTGMISFEALANLKARVEQMSAMVRLDDPTEVIHIVKTLRNRGES